MSLNSLIVYGTEIKEKHDIAKEFNKFFTSIDVKVAAKFGVEGPASHSYTASGVSISASWRWRLNRCLNC